MMQQHGADGDAVDEGHENGQQERLIEETALVQPLAAFAHESSAVAPLHQNPSTKPPGQIENRRNPSHPINSRPSAGPCTLLLVGVMAAIVCFEMDVAVSPVGNESLQQLDTLVGHPASTFPTPIDSSLPKPVAGNQSFGTKPLQRWVSDTCQRFYANESRCLKAKRNKERKAIEKTGWLLPQTCVLEDLHKEGRGMIVRAPLPHHNGKMGTKAANEFIINHDYKFVYVENRKVGSTTMVGLLRTLFNSNFKNSCPGWGKQCFAGQPIKRCSTECLPQLQSSVRIDAYFFFAFVRDPVDRFFSAFRENVKRHRIRVNLGNSTAVCARMEEVLRDMAARRVVFDGHFETQAYSLSSTVRSELGPAMLRFDFVEDLTNMEASLPSLLARIEENAGRQIPAKKKADALHHVRHKNASPEGIANATNRCRSREMELRIRQVYAQDVACFGRQ